MTLEEKNEFTKKLGSSIRHARMRKGLSQEQVAKRIDMSSEAYGRMERGAYMPKLDRVMDICRVLGESPDRLLGL